MGQLQSMFSSPSGVAAEGSISTLDLNSVTGALDVFGVGAQKVELRLACKGVPKKDKLRQAQRSRPAGRRVLAIGLAGRYGRCRPPAPAAGAAAQGGRWRLRRRD